MTVFTNVSDDVLEPGDPIRSVDILAIKENTNYNHQNTVLEILQEDTFTTSGTWTKAAGYDPDDTIVMVFIGGGGGGAAVFKGSSANGSAAGGEAAAANIFSAPYGQAPLSIIYQIGAGGLGATQATQGAITGGQGGSSIFRNDNNTTNILQALGGRGGAGRRTNFEDATSVQTRPHLLHYGIAVDKPSGSKIFAPDTVFQDQRNFPLTYGQEPINPAPLNNFTQIGGSGVLQGTTNRTFYNTMLNPAFFAGGGAGSGTANAANATGFGSGGGGCIRPNTTAVSGAGGSGALVVKYYRGRVSPHQIFMLGA